MVKFVSARDYLIPHICVCIPERVWAYEGCTSASFSHFILRTETKTSSAKDQRIYYMITKYFHAPWNYQMTLLVSLWFLFCFVFIWDESVTSSFNQKYQKSFYSYDKNKLFSYDNIRGIQQARSISFLSFFGESTIKRVNKSEIFNPRTTMTMISSVNTDIGAECFSVALEPSTSRKAARRPTTWAGSDLTTIKSAKKKEKIRK